MGGRVVAEVIDLRAPRTASPFAERLDLDRLEPPLVVDAPRPGDRFDPLGLGGHSMPLADFLRGRRVPRGDRPGVPLVRDALGIVWVVGHRIVHRARLTDATRRVAAVRWDLF
jgi:tRNA(Ile)-lysidine synthase